MSDVPLAAVLVLAAGDGTRMRSATPKVLHRLAGRTLVGHVLAATGELAPERTLVVVGAAAEAVSAHLAETFPAVKPVEQAERRGTGHAVATALAAVPDLTGTVLVVPGDAPLLTAATLDALLTRHTQQSAAATLLTARMPDPTGYGRVVRDGAAVTAVVEERDADPVVREVREVAVSVYAFDAAVLREALDRISSDNAQGEEYLTDVVGLLVADGRLVVAEPAADWSETVGVNDRTQWAQAGRLLRDRLVDRLQRAGAAVVDPATTWVDVDVQVEPDATLLPGTRLEAGTRVGAGAVVGPDSTLVGCTVGPGAVVRSSTAERAEIGPDADVGPYSFLRPGTRLARGVKVGAFVEVKSSSIGEDTKVPHLSYVGDAEIGPGGNLGAGTITANYDGVAKHRTRIGRDVRIGSHTVLVAPVEVGDGVYTAAGSTITDDLPAGTLGIARARQSAVDGWVQRRRPGTAAAAAAGTPGDLPVAEQAAADRIDDQE